ncbi:MAG: flagellar export chaperone FlgN [Phycisphaeraceae bacterium]
MTAKTKPEWAVDLIELLEEQRVIYDQLVGLSEKQSGFVDSGDAESLLAVLAQRQKLIDHLTQINGRIEPFKQNWPKLWAELDGDSQARVQNLIDKVQALLDRIVEQDERDRAALSDHRDRIGAQVKQAHAGSAVNRAYGASAADAQYTDQRG